MVVRVCSESPSNNLVAVSTTHCSCQWLVDLNRLGHWLLHVCVCGDGGERDFYLFHPLVFTFHPFCSPGCCYCIPAHCSV